MKYEIYLSEAILNMKYLILCICQPTISRDIDFIRKQNSSAAKEKTLLTV